MSRDAASGRIVASGRAVALSRNAVSGRATLGIWAPTEFANCEMWYRADLGVTLNGATVSAIADQSGHSRTLSQATPSLQPTFTATTAAYGGRPTMLFDGVGTF